MTEQLEGVTVTRLPDAGLSRPLNRDEYESILQSLLFMSVEAWKGGTVEAVEAHRQWLSTLLVDLCIPVKEES